MKRMLVQLLWLLPLLAQAVGAEEWRRQLVEAAREQTRHPAVYDGAYKRIPYPMGDVAPDRGVCTDVVIRAYRQLGLDLQRQVHEDMKAHFHLYPQLWGLTRPDTNIDHRRVPNLQTWFKRQGGSVPRPPAGALPGDGHPGDLQPGDLLTWMLPGNLPHIGIVSDRMSPDGQRPLIIHNIGAGPQEEDALRVAPITGHYRFAPLAR